MPARLFRRLLALCLSAILSTFAFAAESAIPRERLLFNDGWRFHRGDAPDAGTTLAYAQIRDWIVPTGTELLAVTTPRPTRPANQPEPGARVSFVQPGFDDASWTALALPHDWAISGPFDQNLAGETGKLPYQGVGWYRKRFALSAADAGKRILLEIDGAMSHSTIWLNGRLVGGWPYGYTSYQLDLTPYVRTGAENVLAIRLDNPDESSRWYPGAGLYRNVWLVKTGDVRIRHWGTFVTTPRITPAEALVNVDVYLENLGE
ncbi:MAG TPA: beta galactosidase jelly roll domain-containing protein, partial [Opitutaceae bacterium]|nr:beta galactosidase jelly roll domain-containing protein [Opitutaceae bacterium]